MFTIYKHPLSAMCDAIPGGSSLNNIDGVVAFPAFQGSFFLTVSAILRLLWYSGAAFLVVIFSSISSFWAGLCGVFLLPAKGEMAAECCCSLELWAHRWMLKASALIPFLFICTRKVDH